MHIALLGTKSKVITDDSSGQSAVGNQRKGGVHRCFPYVVILYEWRIDVTFVLDTDSGSGLTVMLRRSAHRAARRIKEAYGLDLWKECGVRLVRLCCFYVDCGNGVQLSSRCLCRSSLNVTIQRSSLETFWKGLIHEKAAYKVSGVVKFST